MIRPTMLLIGLSAFGQAASAQIPTLNGTCPTGIEVHADEGGPIYINGNEARIVSSNENFYEARSGDTSVDLSINPDGSVDLSYTGPGGANGICQTSVVGSMEEGGCPVDVSEADRDQYPACD